LISVKNESLTPLPRNLTPYGLWITHFSLVDYAAKPYTLNRETLHP